MDVLAAIFLLVKVTSENTGESVGPEVIKVFSCSTQLSMKF